MALNNHLSINNMASVPKPFPIFPVYEELKHFEFNDYPQLAVVYHELKDWQQQHIDWAREFLLYTGRNKSRHTYTRFRNEIERFLLWSFLVHDKPIDAFKKTDILDYADFCWQPPVTWIGTDNADRFKFYDGYFQSHENWRPYKMQAPKSHALKKVDKRKYRPSQQTLTSSFTAVISFYNYGRITTFGH